MGATTTPPLKFGVFRYNRTMSYRCKSKIVYAFAMALFVAICGSAQQAPPASAARILLLPRKIVSGEHATLAVLDVNGRLTPGVRVNFSNGDQVTTDATGRALFVAPLNPGTISAVIAGRPGRVYTTILSPTDASSAATEVSSAPRIASISDRFDISGRAFCGDADANKVDIAGRSGLVLASSPMSLVVLPPSDLESGEALIGVGCGKNESQPFSIRFVELTLEANSSPLAPGDHRELTVRVKGTKARLALEAHNLAPNIADLNDGNPARVSSSGGEDNAARFQLTGKQRGSFVVSIRLLPNQAAPRR
jgi:hypothetical protein